MYQKPRLFISNYFKFLRTEIDAALEKHSKILTTPDIKSELKENHTKLIEKVNSYEAECLKRQPNDSFEKSLNEETKQIIVAAKKGIEFLADAVKQGKGEPTFDVNGDPEEDTNEFSDDIQDIEDLIYDQMLILERTLLINRTLLFLEEESSIASAVKVFSKMNYLTTVGKLFIITNEYFGKRGLNSLSTKVIVDGSYMQRLTNETIKAMHLKKQLEERPTSNQIEIMELDNSNFNKLEIINRQIRFLHPDMFRGLGKIKLIDLNFNIITKLEENVFRGLFELETLILLKNKIEFIPATTLRDLKSLKTVTFRENHLKRVDERTFEGLTNLEVIYLYYNQLKSLPANLFKGLTGLRDLYLGGNFLTRLDVNLFRGLSNLKELYLSHNSINEIEDDQFKDLTNLECIMLNNNNIKTLTARMFINNKKLQKIWINDNMLKSIDSDIIQNIPTLKALYLYNNFLPKEQARKDYFSIEPGRYVLIET